MARTATVEFSKIAKSFSRPPLRIGRGVAEHVEEEGGDDSTGLGAGGVGAAPDVCRTVQQADDPPLLIERRETKLHIFQIRTWNALLPGASGEICLTRFSK